VKTWRDKLTGWGKSPSFFICWLAIIFSVFYIGAEVTKRQPVVASSQLSTHQAIDSITTPIISKTDPATKTAVKGFNTLSNLQLPAFHQGLSDSNIPQLQKLAEYEQAAGGAVATGMMYFTDYPDSVTGAKSAATDMYSTLKSFAKYGLTPLIIMEPTNSKGSLNFQNYSNGAYDGIVDAYFQTLKNLGASDSEVGIWTYFPEANLPEWGPVDTADFAPNVTRTVNIQKKYFPNSRASIMLDAESYPAGSTDWGNGSYVSISPFINGIPKGLLDSFGLQGFPWAPPANSSGDASYDPNVYLNGNLAVQAATQLGVTDIWLNTGTFHAMYTGSRAGTIYLSPSQRQSMLDVVVSQAVSIKGKGFKTEVNLFSEDKSNTDEATDWSYKSTDDQAVFKAFSQQLYSYGIGLWLFDS